MYLQDLAATVRVRWWKHRTRIEAERTARILDALSTCERCWLYPIELMAAAKVGAGDMYPILTRLLADGHVERRWQDEASTGGRPPRRAWRLTPSGHALARSITREGR